jgi:hypothetical protein
MRMSAAADAVELISPPDELASRYEALIRLAEAIRSHPSENELFHTLERV